ncbi:MAG: hypothetical protein RR547_04290, partial [Raoultibacter sp.]
IKAPVCCISHSVNEGDIAELATFIQYYQIKQIDTMTLVSPVNCILDTNALQDSIAAIHQEAKSQDIIDISLSDFTKAFSIQNAVVNDTIIVPFLMKGIKRTSLRFYTTPNLWLIQPIATIAVLFVAEHDEAVLPAIVSQFKKYIEPHLSNTPAYSLPPLQFD